MTVTPQTSLPVTFEDRDPDVPGSGTPVEAAPFNQNFGALLDGLNEHAHSEYATQLSELSDAPTGSPSDGDAWVREGGAWVFAAVETPSGAQAKADAAAAASVPKSTVTTKGDLIVGSGPGTVARVGAGADGDLLVADSAQTDGVKWATPSSALGGSMPYVGNVVCEGILEGDGVNNHYVYVCGVGGGINNISGYWNHVWVAAQQSTGLALYKSTDNLATGIAGATQVWPSGGGLDSTYYYIRSLLELSDGTLLMCVQLTSNSQQAKIIRSTDSGATWTAVYTFQADPVGSTLLDNYSWFEDVPPAVGGTYANCPNNPGVVYMAEYGEGAGATMNILESTDYGATWTSIYQFTDIRHIHLIQRDPYTGRMWCGTGDTNTQSRLGYSTDNGVTFTWVFRGENGTEEYNRARATFLMFDATYMYWGSDNGVSDGTVYRYNKTTGQVDTPGANLVDAARGGFRDPVSGRMVLFTQCISPNKYIEFIASNDGSSWAISQRWRRSTNGGDSIPVFFSPPDKNAGSWAYIQSLAGTEHNSDDASLYMRSVKARIGDQWQQMQAQHDIAQREHTINWQAPSNVLEASGASQAFYVVTHMPYDWALIDAYLWIGTALASDASNYWTITVRRNHGGTVSGGYAVWGGASKAISANTPVARNTAVYNRGAQGDAILVEFDRSGTPADVVKPIISIVVRRINTVDL